MAASDVRTSLARLQSVPLTSVSDALGQRHAPGRPARDRSAAHQTGTERAVARQGARGKVLVTGANGFIGSNLIVHYSATGAEAVAAVRPGRRLRAEMAAQCPAIDYREVDFTSVEGLKRALVGVETVVHTAGCVAGHSYWQFAAANRTATRRLLEAAAAMPAPPHVILLSSVAAAGPRTTDRPRTADDRPEPISLYGRSKLAAERVARRYADRVPITVLRPGIVFGPGDREVLRLIKLIAASHINFVPGWRQTLFPFIAVDDLVAAIDRVRQRGAVLPAMDERQVDREGLRGEGIYYLADPQFCSFATLGRWISEGLGRRWSLTVPIPLRVLTWAARISMRFSTPSHPSTFTVDKIREARAAGWECDVRKAIEELDWKPAASLAERLRQTIAWYRHHGWLR